MENLKEIFKKYESKIITVLGLVLVAAISFQGGYFQGKNQQTSSIIIEDAQKCLSSNGSSDISKVLGKEDESTKEEQSDSKKDCAFIGSKNSNKYHLPSCRYAKNIKEENIVCFSDQQDAENKGYKPCGQCIK